MVYVSLSLSCIKTSVLKVRCTCIAQLATWMSVYLKLDCYVKLSKYNIYVHPFPGQEKKPVCKVVTFTSGNENCPFEQSVAQGFQAGSDMIETTCSQTREELKGK